jgi:hypothetical protein
MSNKQVFIIALSEITPNALIKINKGIGFLTFGTDTTIWLLERDGDGDKILTAVVLIGFEASSDTDLISAE